MVNNMYCSAQLTGLWTHLTDISIIRKQFSAALTSKLTVRAFVL